MEAADGSDMPLQDGRFLLVETLGRGAMGTVYRAFDGNAQRLVALKVSSEAGPSGPAHPLATEYEIASRVRHPALVRALDLVHARTGPFPRGTPYLVLEHADGLPSDRAFVGGRVDSARLIHVATRLAAALGHLHELGYVHRDVKPANVLVARRASAHPEVRLVDFGLACPVGTVREPGRLSGSLPFLAPESLLGLPIDGRTDLYALGLLLYQLAAGRAPIAEPDPAAWVRWHLNAAPVELGRPRPDLPARLVDLVRELTRRDPASRPASAREALLRLGAPSGHPTRRPCPASGRERVRLRAALDAARLGAVRLYALPHGDAEALDLLHEVEVLARVRGIDVHDWPTSRLAIARLAVRIAAARFAVGSAALRKHELGRWLPLAWVGGVPLADPLRESPVEDASDVDAGRALIAFLLECARHRPLVLTLASTYATGGLADRVARGLSRLDAGKPRFLPGAGGVLLVVRRGARSASRLVRAG